jgi:hypothetical protein
VYSFAVVLIAASAFTKLIAQEPRLAPNSIGQIVDEVIRALLPPDKSVSRVPVASRGIFLDHARTMAGFHQPTSPEVSLSNLGLRSTVKVGGPDLLEDCDQTGLTPCNRLGWAVYLLIEPVSVTNSEALVRARIGWPDRRKTPFVPGMAPTGRASLAGFIADVKLVRGADGAWKFDKLDRMLAL